MLFDHNLVLWVCIASLVLFGFLVEVVLFGMYKLVNIRVLYCMKNCLQWSVHCTRYFTLTVIFWSITILCSSVELAAPRATIPNLRREEKRACYARISKRWRGVHALSGTGRGEDAAVIPVIRSAGAVLDVNPSSEVVRNILSGTSRLHNVVYVHRLFDMCLQESPQCYVPTARVSLDHCLVILFNKMIFGLFHSLLYT